MAPSESIIFEYAVTEHTRFCLCFEHLYQQAQHYLDQQGYWANRAFISTILELLTLLDRADLRSKLSQEISRQLYQFNRLLNTPEVQQDKLLRVIDELDRAAHNLNHYTTQLASLFRENDFLNDIRHQAKNPGGTSPVNTPAFYVWLKQSNLQQYQQAQQWLHCFTDLHKIAALLLRLLRDSGNFKPCQAQKGFYQTTSDSPWQLIRVMLNTSEPIYPKINVGRHGLSIHFLNLQADGKSAQLQTDLAFSLACLAI